jgi:alpha-glucosidase
MENLKWWQTAVFYQIYPRSFADGNGDGIGDFIGMTEKLDYLKDLGIDALWLSPHFPSPQADCGYDVADYTGVAPEYGTLDEFKTFLAEAHRRGLRVILDMVFNHTSDEHAWFIESRSSRDNPKRDWYVWRDPAPGGGPPNNWESTFTGSAWEYDETTGQYYYHFFLKEQPDLNWRNPEVKAAMWDAVRFWLDLGVDGYRLDAIGTIFEDPDMPNQTTGMTLLDLYRLWMTVRSQEEADAAEEVWKEMFRYQVDRPDEMHPLMKELRTVVDEYEGRMLVGEDDNIAYYGNGDDELHMVFNFPLMRTERLTPEHIRKNQAERLAALPPGAWPCNTLGNHDSPRVWTRYGDGTHDRERAQLSLALMLTLRGTPFLYNGEEIGMTNMAFDDVAVLRDTVALRQYDMAVNVGGMEPQAATALVCGETRDRCRTPVQWSNAPNAGFCPADVMPWLPVNPNYAAGVNVADQQTDPQSMLAFYKRMLAIRKQTPALIGREDSRGDYTPLLENHADCVCFLRSTDAQTCLVVLNYSENAQTLAFDLDGSPSRLIFSTENRPDAGDLSALTIAPFEIYIAELKS